MYVDVTFQLDHNEDYESIEYILLSTAFAHEIDAVIGSTSGFSYGSGKNELEFILLDNMGTFTNEDYNFRTVPYWTSPTGDVSFEATNLYIRNPDQKIIRERKTLNFGESIYSDVLLPPNGIEYYKPDNNALRANFLYDPVLGSQYNRIDDGVFTKTDENRFEFYHYYYDSGGPYEDQDFYTEQRLS